MHSTNDTAKSATMKQQTGRRLGVRLLSLLVFCAGMLWLGVLYVTYSGLEPGAERVREWAAERQAIIEEYGLEHIRQDCQGEGGGARHSMYLMGNLQLVKEFGIRDGELDSSIPAPPSAHMRIDLRSRPDAIQRIAHANAKLERIYSETSRVVELRTLIPLFTFRDIHGSLQASANGILLLFAPGLVQVAVLLAFAFWLYRRSATATPENRESPEDAPS